MRKKLVSICLLLTLAITCLVGCTNSNVETGAKSSIPQELVVAVGQAEFANLNPFHPKGSSTWLLRPLLYEPLVYSTINGVEGALAESWKCSTDGKTWTFNLRKNVKFHDGSLFDSKVVKQTIERSLQDKIRGLGSRRPPIPIESVEASDANTLVLHLSSPYSPLLTEISGVWMVSPNAYDDTGKFVNAIGTGPFTIASFSKQNAVFEPFAHYWRGKPKLNKVTVRCIPDHNSRVMAFEAGEVDVIGADLAGVDTTATQRLQQSGNYKVINKTQALIEWLGFNTQREPLHDVRVRQAINYALDREAMVKNLLGGYGVVAVGPIGFDSSMPWTDTSIKGYSYKPEKAKQLLTEAGWIEKDNEGYLVKDGKQLKLDLTFYELRPFTKAMAEVMQSQLRNVGINVNLTVVERGSFSSVIQQKNFDMAIVPCYGKSEDDPYKYLSMFFFSKGPYSIMNNPKFDGIFMQQFKADQAKREKMYHQLQQIIMEECPAAFLLHGDKIMVMKKDIQKFDVIYGWDALRPLWKVTRGGK